MQGRARERDIAAASAVRWELAAPGGGGAVDDTCGQKP